MAYWVEGPHANLDVMFSYWVRFLAPEVSAAETRVRRVRKRIASLLMIM